MYNGYGTLWVVINSLSSRTFLSPHERQISFNAYKYSLTTYEP